MAKITVKRMVPLITIVTDKFKKGISDNTLSEIKVIDNQIASVQNQIKQLQGRFGILSGESGKSAQEQTNASIVQLNEKLERMKNFKKGLLASLDDIKNKPNGTEIQTGMIENYVELEKGDNIRNIFGRAKIIIKDDIIQEIVE